jgi:hypothetical protein
MATQRMAKEMETGSVQSMTFDRFAGSAAIAAGVLGFLYSIAFVVLKQQTLYSLCLMLGGLATAVVMVGLYTHLSISEPGVAQIGLLLGTVAALGSAIHAGYDLANAVNPPASAAGDLPSQIDPRGFLTFGVAGLALFGFSWLMSSSNRFPRSLAYMGFLLALLLIVIYLGRLIILDANSPAILLPAALVGFLVNPAWNIWLGLTLLKNDRQA